MREISWRWSPMLWRISRWTSSSMVSDLPISRAVNCVNWCNQIKSSRGALVSIKHNLFNLKGDSLWGQHGWDENRPREFRNLEGFTEKGRFRVLLRFDLQGLYRFWMFVQCLQQIEGRYIWTVLGGGEWWALCWPIITPYGDFNCVEGAVHSHEDVNNFICWDMGSAKANDGLVHALLCSFACVWTQQHHGSTQGKRVPYVVRVWILRL